MSRLLRGACSRSGGRDTPGAVIRSSFVMLLHLMRSWGICILDIGVVFGDGNWENMKRIKQKGYWGFGVFSCFSFVLL